MSITSKAMLAGVAISMWSARKLDRDITDQTNREHAATADAGRYNKMLMPAGALADITTIAGKIRAEHYARTLPWADNGNRILSAVGYADFANVMRGLIADFDNAADAFARDYDGHREQRKRELNGMFKESDYPTADEIRARFRAKARIWPMPDAADFRVDLSAGESERIKAEIQAEFDANVQMAMRDVFTRVADVLARMVDRLKAYAPGSREGNFTGTLVENVRDLVKLVPSLNVTSNATLARICERMERDLCRYDAPALKEDAAIRRDTANAAAEILAEVSDFMA
jgi:hypothetical protein